MHRRRRYCPGLTLLLATLGTTTLSAAVLEKTTHIDGTTVQYRVVLPNGYDPNKAYPAVLAFGGGPQTIEGVDNLIARNFREQAEQRGYIVVAPAAPGGQLFFEGGERIFPAFLEQILKDYRIEDGKFHVAGPSNGGISAFQVAYKNPQYFLSITGFPGLMRVETPEHIQAISRMCIHMFVGELDPLGWQDLMRAQTADFQAHGLSATFAIEPGQPHRLETLAGPNSSRLFDLFEQARHGCSR